MSAPTDKNTPAEAAKVSNFLRQIIENDLEKGTYATRRWAGSPGDAAHHATGQPDPARIRTRFPPEPNGYLHIGHAKSICLNFGLARDYGGVCHMRFDDTNPEKEDTEYVDSILDAVQWLGFSWNSTFDGKAESHLYQASDYFDFMYRAAVYLIEAGHAYVDEQTAEEMRLNRGDFGKPGVNSPFRSRTPAENLARFRGMRDGQFEDGSMVLRAKIDMAHPNINLRDPAIYRIRRATHHNTGDKWCIYPMYTFAHPIEDALEQITHSICTLEFEDQRPFYDWLMERLIEGGLLASPPPHQYEFAPPEPHLCDHQQAQAGAAGVRPQGQRLGRPAFAHHRRPAPARLHARGPAAVCRTHRRDQERQLDRLQHAGRLPARRPGKQGPPRHGRAGPGETGTDQLGRGLWQRRLPGRLHPARPAPQRPA
jgi:glutaminyl-tRNA synthetase